MTHFSRSRLAALAASSIVAASTALVAGCDRADGPPLAQEISDARVRVDATLTAGGQVQLALAVLGEGGDTVCEELPAAVALAAAQRIHAANPCLAIETNPSGGSVDVVLRPEATCRVAGHTLGGALTLRATRVGTPALHADFSALQVDGEALPVDVGVEGCGDARAYTAHAQGSLDGRSDHTYRIDARVSVSQSSGFFGSTMVYEVTATGAILRGDGEDRLELDHVRYRAGDLLPTGGAVRITTSDGTFVEAAFRGETPFVGELVLTIDAHDPVTLPTLH